MKKNLLHRIFYQYEYKIVYKRAAFTLFILLIYILGSHMTIVDQSDMRMHDETFYRLAVSNVGGNINTLNVFTLGLGPWLTALVILMLWRYRNSEKMLRQTRRERHRQEKCLTVVFSLIQGYFVIHQYIRMEQLEKVNIWMLLLVLVTGTMLLIWLADQNVRYGIAGAMPIVLLSIIRTLFYQKMPSFSMDGRTMAIVMGAIVMIMVILLFLELVEYRLGYFNIMQVEQTQVTSFVAWKLNPAGSIAIMMSLSVYILLNSLFNMGIYFLTGTIKTISVTQLSHPVGVTLYIVVQILLGYGLSRLLINTKLKAKEFLKAGHYFDGISPGVETETYLHQKARIICWMGTLIVGMIMGVPLYLSLMLPHLSQQVYIAIQLMILIYIGMNIAETMRTYFYFDKYRQFLTKYW
ncbi:MULTISPECIES: accessory Sec system protein translocase subunit SecY2 [unclassified Staphylococcus]|uniref:accessory Sec system protein translocase subunit SecY2 n=1 Tax=unclassified Staphylococcus TaxID=91994 RepID=UPI0021D2A056|nr:MULTISPECIES: accessory Sec system protein translocase subunit SecY2 [unclassified Staphylococcus]UXR78483.1 accessory Sec system protein translocase subunit SecY2 [Staphylococcus sp. IVB6227]UXR82641.1 accessory Sec system protein translocase subunit SecY2 [Staphylococcus sp. IVB6214]